MKSLIKGDIKNSGNSFSYDWRMVYLLHLLVIRKAWAADDSLKAVSQNNNISYLYCENFQNEK